MAALDFNFDQEQTAFQASVVHMSDVGHLFAYISLSLLDQEQTAFQV